MWNNIVKYGTIWSKLEQTGANWSKLEQAGANWSKLEQCRVKWNNAEQSDAIPSQEMLTNADNALPQTRTSTTPCKLLLLQGKAILLNSKGMYLLRFSASIQMLNAFEVCFVVCSPFLLLQKYWSSPRYAC